jgi:hypothetical protein
MRLLFTILCVAAVLAFAWCPIAAQEGTGQKGSDFNPDLPLERPLPEETEEPPEEEPGEVPGTEPTPGETPPEEEIPESPPPEFFEEPIETSEVIFVIDRTSSMEWPSELSVEDENGNIVNNAAKIDVARIELVKTIGNLSENTKFAVVGFSCGSSGYSYDTNWDGATNTWKSWPPAQGQPAPFGMHINTVDNIPIWPTNKALVPGTPENKTAAITWVQANFNLQTVTGGTNTDKAMITALGMVTPPPPGKDTKTATAIYCLTDGAPTAMGSIRCSFTGVLNSPIYWGDATWQQIGYDTTKASVATANKYQAKIYTLGIGMDNSAAQMLRYNPTTGQWLNEGNSWCDKCRQFLTQMAEATGGHYREVSK